MYSINKDGDGHFLYLNIHPTNPPLRLNVEITSDSFPNPGEILFDYYNDFNLKLNIADIEVVNGIITTQFYNSIEDFIRGMLVQNDNPSIDLMRYEVENHLVSKNKVYSINMNIASKNASAEIILPVTPLIVEGNIYGYCFPKTLFVFNKKNANTDIDDYEKLMSPEKPEGAMINTESLSILNSFKKTKEVEMLMELLLPGSVSLENLKMEHHASNDTPEQVPENMLNIIALPEQENPHAELCEYFTHYVDKDNFTVSDHYSFGNFIPNACVCSSPQMLEKNKNQLSVCRMRPAQQVECRMFSSNGSVIAKKIVLPKNSSTQIEFELYSYIAINGDMIFNIRNVTDNTLLNKIVVNCSIDQEEAIKEGLSIFDEYISCYTDHTVEEPEFNIVTSTKESFIATLIGV